MSDTVTPQQDPLAAKIPPAVAESLVPVPENAAKAVAVDGKPATHRRHWKWIIIVVAIALIGWWIRPWIITALNTVSTDDAYIDGHVTFVAPRVSGQVLRVLVDDNVRVKAGDLLVEIDPEPFQVQVAIKKALVEVAETDLLAAHSQVEGLIGQTRAARFALEHAIETVKDQIALLHSNVAQLNVEKANLVLAQKDYDRYKRLLEQQAATQADFDIYSAKLDSARSRVDSAGQVVQETRAKLGLPINEDNPLDVPEGLEQNFSLVREALATLLQNATQIGYQPKSFQLTPQQAVVEFLKQDADGNLDRIYARLSETAPLIKQSQAKVMQAKRDLEEAELNLRYCKVVSEIDGVITRRNVNPGNYVQVAQTLMAVRSLTEIWVTANFKETQLKDLRIGQPARMEVDMYGSKKEFTGRISGFLMGTGQTLALLPPQNATGNFIKIVQRLPVRIEFTNYNPEKDPLFVGLSVVPYVYFKEQATGPHAGSYLQSLAPLPEVTADPKTEAREAAGLKDSDSKVTPATP